MAVEEGIGVVFTGDASSFIDELAKAQAQVRKFDAALATLDKKAPAFDAVSKGADRARQKLQELGGGGVAKTTRDFTGLSRVIQDLPYGFNAISNNLTQILPAAGLAGLAVSGLTSAITFATMGFDAWTRMFPSADEALNKNIEQTKKAQEALRNYVQSLEDVRQARVIGAQQAQEELVHLQTLYNATQNANIPLSKRKQLVDELQEQYPKYFANIKDETILAGGAEGAYKKLSAAIIATARARAAQDKVVELQKEALALEEKHTNTVREQSASFEKLTKLKIHNAAAGASLGDIESGAASFEQLDNLRDLEKEQAKQNKLLREGADIAKQIFAIQDRTKKLVGEVTDIVVETPDVLMDPGGKLDKAVKEHIFELPSRTGPIAIKTPDMYFENLNKLNIREANKELEKHIKNIFEDRVIPARLNIAPESSGITAEEALQKAGYFEMMAKMNTIVQSGFTGLAISFGEGLGAALAGEGFENIGKGVVTTLGNIIAQLGKTLIEGSLIIQAFKKSLGTLITNPAAALGVGVAMVAIGSAIRAKASQLGKTAAFAEGGLVFGPTLGMVGEGRGTSRSNPEVIAPLNKLQNFVGGGSEFPEYLPMHSISNDGLLLWYKRAEKGRRADR